MVSTLFHRPLTTDPYMEAISPNEVARAVDPIPARMHPYTRDAGPPLNSAN